MPARRFVSEILVPAEHGRAYHLKKGQTHRIIMIEGPQVGDIAIFSAHNLKETFDPDTSYVCNTVQGTGTDKMITPFYSRAPHLRVMFRVTKDTVQAHWVMNGSKCTVKRYELMGLRTYHRNCFDNLAEAITPFDLTPEDIPDVYNLFINVGFDENGRYQFRPPAGGRGDYTEMIAEMDCLVALSACPGGDQSVINGDGPDKGNRPQKVEIWEE